MDVSKVKRKRYERQRKLTRKLTPFSPSDVIEAMSWYHGEASKEWKGSTKEQRFRFLRNFTKYIEVVSGKSRLMDEPIEIRENLVRTEAMIDRFLKIKQKDLL